MAAGGEGFFYQGSDKIKISRKPIHEGIFYQMDNPEHFLTFLQLFVINREGIFNINVTEFKELLSIYRKILILFGKEKDIDIVTTTGSRESVDPPPYSLQTIQSEDHRPKLKEFLYRWTEPGDTPVKEFYRSAVSLMGTDKYSETAFKKDMSEMGHIPIGKQVGKTKRYYYPLSIKPK
jgi:hypothetical protein